VDVRRDARKKCVEDVVAVAASVINVITGGRRRIVAAIVDDVDGNAINPRKSERLWKWSTRDYCGGEEQVLEAV